MKKMWISVGIMVAIIIVAEVVAFIIVHIAVEHLSERAISIEGKEEPIAVPSPTPEEIPGFDALLQLPSDSGRERKV